MEIKKTSSDVLGRVRYSVFDSNGDLLCTLVKITVSLNKTANNKKVSGWAVEGTEIGKHMPVKTQERAIERFLLRDLQSNLLPESF